MFSAKQLFLFVFATSLLIARIHPQSSLAGIVQVSQATGNLHLEVAGAAGLGTPAGDVVFGLAEVWEHAVARLKGRSPIISSGYWKQHPSISAPSPR